MTRSSDLAHGNASALEVLVQQHFEWGLCSGIENWGGCSSDSGVVLLLELPLLLEQLMAEGSCGRIKLVNMLFLVHHCTGWRELKSKEMGKK